jgi:methyl-accepting chemotaxis protein
MKGTAAGGRLSVRARLATGFGLLVGMMGVLVAIALVLITGQQAAQREIAGKALPYLGGLSDASLAAKAAANDERGFLLSGDKKFSDEAVQRRAAQADGLARARAAAVNADAVASVERIRAGLAAFNSALDKEFALYATDRQAAIAAAMGPNRDLRKAYEAAIADAVTAAHKYADAANAESEQRASEGRTLLIGAVVVVGLVGAAAALVLARSVTRPLAAAVDVLEGAAGGDLTRRARVQGATEFRRMAEATNDMLVATAETVRAIADSSAALVTTADHLAATSDELTSSAEGASARAGGVSVRAGQVSAGVRTVSVSAEEMGTTVGGISAAVSQAASVASDAVTSADSARQAVKQLDDSAHQIGAVVKLITSIAEQTNLLALNATIEAARAGDAGKGFAVVAGEVKDLAQETAKATDEIATQVGAIQNDTRRAVEAIGRINDVITSVNEYQAAIATTVEEQAATTNEMSRSIFEIATGADDIAVKINDVAGAVTGTAESIRRVRQTSAGLTAMAAELRRRVEEFRY